MCVTDEDTLIRFILAKESSLALSTGVWSLLVLLKCLYGSRLHMRCTSEWSLSTVNLVMFFKTT